MRDAGTLADLISELDHKTYIAPHRAIMRSNGPAKLRPSSPEHLNVRPLGSYEPDVGIENHCD